MELVSSLPVYPVSATMDTRAINVQFVRVGTTEMPPHTHTPPSLLFISHISFLVNVIEKLLKLFCVFFLLLVRVLIF